MKFKDTYCLLAFMQLLLLTLLLVVRTVSSSDCFPKDESKFPRTLVADNHSSNPFGINSRGEMFNAIAAWEDTSTNGEHFVLIGGMVRRAELSYNNAGMLNWVTRINLTHNAIVWVRNYDFTIDSSTNSMKVTAIAINSAGTMASLYAQGKLEYNNILAIIVNNLSVITVSHI